MILELNRPTSHSYPENADVFGKSILIFGSSYQNGTDLPAFACIKDTTIIYSIQCLFYTLCVPSLLPDKVTVSI